MYDGGKDFTDARGNVDRDSDEEEAANPEPFQPTYDSVPLNSLNRPIHPPQYRPTPSYPHGGGSWNVTSASALCAILMGQCLSPMLAFIFLSPTLSLL